MNAPETATIAPQREFKPRPKSPSKPKKTPLPTLIAKADKITSLYIRQKFADSNGCVKCVSCGKVLAWQSAHCAHFIGRAKKATRWLEENLHPACCGCNTFNKEFHMREYTLYMIDMYGREFIDELNEMIQPALSSSQVRQLAEEAIEYYSAQLKELNAAN